MGAGAVLAYSFVLTLVIGFAISKTIGFRIDEEDEVEGVDFTEHSEIGLRLRLPRSVAPASLTGGTRIRRSVQSDAEARGVNA